MGLIDSVVSCQQLCDNIINEAEHVIKNRLNPTMVSQTDSKSEGAVPTIKPHYIVRYTYVEDAGQCCNEILQMVGSVTDLL